MPIFRGSMPEEMLRAMKVSVPDDQKPRQMLKKLHDSGTIAQIDRM